METFITIVGALGGVETLKFFLNRRYNRRIAGARASEAEFHTLQITTEFLQAQLREKEERYAEQTAVVRRLNQEVIELTRQLGQKDIELALKRCEVTKCLSRQPQNGY